MRIAILDLYEGTPNQGMRCIREIIREWASRNAVAVQLDEFEVRLKDQLPDLSYDVYISSGGPGSPVESAGSSWDDHYCQWLDSIEKWNRDEEQPHKKFVFLVCHSFQMACRYYKLGSVSKRKKPAFGVFPVHVTHEGQGDELLKGLPDPFYVVDSRDWQVVDPDFEKIRQLGGTILCIEKYRPHVPYQQALMALRFDPYMVGTQFHPEADAIGMRVHLQKEDKKKLVIETHGIEKWNSMMEQLNDPDKIMSTYAHIIPNFLSSALRELKEVEVRIG